MNVQLGLNGDQLGKGLLQEGATNPKEHCVGAPEGPSRNFPTLLSSLWPGPYGHFVGSASVRGSGHPAPWQGESNNIKRPVPRDPFHQTLGTQVFQE